MVSGHISRPKSFMERLGQGFAQGAATASQLIPEHLIENRRQQQEKERAKELGLNIEGLTSETKQNAFQQALQAKFNKQKLHEEMDLENKSYDKIKERFGEKFADIWKTAPVGGRTELLKAALQASGRNQDIDNILSGAESKSGKENERFESIEDEPATPESKFEKDLSYYLRNQDEGLLPAEKIKRGKERYDTGLKPYQEAGIKLRGLARDKERIDILEGLEKSKKLPEDIERLNVDSEGNLRLPFLASPEAQRYVKTLNEFSTGAKDTFGARVTNFDLAQYLRRYPTLLNSAEGRRQLYEQMKLVNQINAVYYKNLQKVYDKAGGVRNIDADAAERFAERLSEEKVNELASKFQDIGPFSSRPSASEFKGKKIRDKETGEIFQSNGADWLPVE
jgi:hypothetical protein